MWRLTPRPRTRYQRNPLETVLVQLQFHPVLKFPDRIGEFQDRVRGVFPIYSSGALQSFDLTMDGSVRAHSQKLFRFFSEDRRRELHATETSLTLTLRSYQHREELSRDFLSGVRALHESVGAVSTRRLGLRFVNMLRRDRIGAALGRSVQWDGLIHADYRPLPSLLDDPDSARTLHEITSECDPGALTLRFGVVPELPRPDLYFRFDIDRYLEGAIEEARIDALLSGFTDDCFAMFHSALGPDLREWMGPEIRDDL